MPGKLDRTLLLAYLKDCIMRLIAIASATAEGADTEIGLSVSGGNSKLGMEVQNRQGAEHVKACQLEL